MVFGKDTSECVFRQESGTNWILTLTGSSLLSENAFWDVLSSYEPKVMVVARKDTSEWVFRKERGTDLRKPSPNPNPNPELELGLGLELGLEFIVSKVLYLWNRRETTRATTGSIE